ncbi:P-loop containing nucleoside triphosphate hydrolase protein [Mycena olivaceomarginata]|nr:P-loop containing nucleoside triphosphate hydrolase protein [Mycena olivaceomarginata]
MLLPAGTPVLATSATLNAEALKDVCTGLNLDLDESFFLNLGNDRPNITPSVVHMKSSRDYGAVDAQLPDPATIHTPADMPKTMVFTNAIKKTQILCRHIRQLFPNLPRHSIDFLHAHRTAKAKRRIMKQFRKGKIKILVATEAAGMGADIPDVELVIQFGVPPSLPVWIQRYGRAGRHFDIQARAVMLVEKSMEVPAPAPAEPELGAHSDSDSSSDESDAEVAAGKSVPKKADAASVDLNDGRVWGKNVDPVLREYISTALCRRDIADKHFNNPPRRAPTGPSTSGSRPRTPEQPDSISSSAHSTPSKRANANGKRPMGKRGDGPALRRGQHLQDARDALGSWRTRTFLGRYSTSPFITDVGILPDKILTSLASKRIRTVPWMFSQRHGEEVIEVLRRLDHARLEQKAQAAQAKKAAKRKETEAFRAAEQLKKKLAAAAKPPRGRMSRKRHPQSPSQRLPPRQPLAALPEHVNQIPATPIRIPTAAPYPTPQSIAGPSSAYSHPSPLPYSPYLQPYWQPCPPSMYPSPQNSHPYPRPFLYPPGFLSPMSTQPYIILPPSHSARNRSPSPDFPFPESINPWATFQATHDNQL